MKFQLTIPIKKGDLVYIIEHCKIAEHYVEGFEFSEFPTVEKDISNILFLHLNRYNNGKDFSRTKIRLSECFLTKQELIEQL